ncbi:diaminopimelate decarboxylase family protein [Dactylosporangium sucinum]|uniref:Diaminopimelate decarboxylase n=1 Tax=Dactylosporangium sucinum TaxID=1424081 RepID=A0A917TVT2_9ACTN|nr:alanine racemase [Dactylosporangium sucinum]GGM40775.1 diaminopimelate decarboxylase [Dactylosporangium sucinum]
MTLTDIIPSLRSSLPARLDTGVWPRTAHWGDAGDLRAGGVSLAAVAAEHGTPTFVLDEEDVRERCRTYAGAFGAGDVAYTGKALLTVDVARWIAAEGLGLYAGSAGEVRVAERAGFDMGRVVLYGSAKSPEDLDVAYRAGVGTVVVESMGEITRLAATAPAGQRVLLRIVDGPDRRFGLRVAGGEAAAAVARIAGQPGLRLAGYDCSIGHQLSRFSQYEREISRLCEFASVMYRAHGVAPERLNLGGGHAVAYRPEEFDLALAGFATRMRSVLHLEAGRHGLPAPRLTVSPGRAVVARAGVTVYRVLAVTRTQAGDRLVAVDGGMTDCPATALCGSRHSAVLIGRTGRAAAGPAVVVGRHNDADDVVVPDAELPADVHPGDLLAVAGTGAYHHARATNFHLVRRPALLAVAGGRARVLVRRESLDDLLARDAG